MCVYSRIVGQSVVYYMCQVVDIQTAGSDVGSHQHRNNTVAELAHHYVALLLRQVAVKSLGIISVGYKAVGDFLGIASGAAEDYGVDAGELSATRFRARYLSRALTI